MANAGLENRISGVGVYLKNPVPASLVQNDITLCCRKEHLGGTHRINGNFVLIGNLEGLHHVLSGLGENHHAGLKERHAGIEAVVYPAVSYQRYLIISYLSGSNRLLELLTGRVLSNFNCFCYHSIFLLTVKIVVKCLFF